MCFLGVLVPSYLLALVTSLTFESPMMGLEKVLLHRINDQRQVHTTQHTEELITVVQIRIQRQFHTRKNWWLLYRQSTPRSIWKNLSLLHRITTRDKSTQRSKRKN